METDVTLVPISLKYIRPFKDLIKNSEKKYKNIEYRNHCSVYLGVVVISQLIH